MNDTLILLALQYIRVVHFQTSKYFSYDSHDTRFANDPQYNERRNFAIVYNSFLSTAPQHYSLLPITVRNSTSIESFSKNFKKLFI